VLIYLSFIVIVIIGFYATQKYIYFREILNLPLKELREFM